MKQFSSLPNGARVKRPVRNQIELIPGSLDDRVPDDHRVRVLWAYVDSLDLGPLYEKIRAVEGGPGRDPVDPKILVTLWMYATIESISSAHRIDTLCKRDDVYKWICGGVGVNYHLLSDFRVGHGDFLDDLLTNSVAALMHQKLVTLKGAAQDGMRVRANAGSSSFRREPTLQECLKQAREQVQTLREKGEQEDSSEDARREAARKRAAEDRQKRVEKALEEAAKLHAQKEQQKKGSGTKARCSTTDPEARTMKMGDGGFRPAYNVQFATDSDTRIIVSVDVTNSGSDRGELQPMQENIKERYGIVPEQMTTDGGFATKDDITAAERNGTKVIAPVQREEQMLEKGQDPYARRAGDSDEMFAFRQRMATDEAKAILKQRSSIAEFPNAECRNRGLQQYRVRGLQKVKAVTLWYAITFNFMRMLNLGFLQ